MGSPLSKVPLYFIILRTYARGKVISLVVIVVVDTKIAKSGGVGT